MQSGLFTANMQCYWVNQSIWDTVLRYTYDVISICKVDGG